MVSEKDLQSYLKVAASALPCREARKEFSSYVHNVAHDISIENPDADFATVASLLGTTPKQVAADFVESQCESLYLLIQRINNQPMYTEIRIISTCQIICTNLIIVFLM